MHETLNRFTFHLKDCDTLPAIGSVFRGPHGQICMDLEQIPAPDFYRWLNKLARMSGMHTRFEEINWNQCGTVEDRWNAIAMLILISKRFNVLNIARLHSQLKEIESFIEAALLDLQGAHKFVELTEMIGSDEQ